MNLNIDLSQFQNLDPQNMGGWPLAAKGLVVLAVVAMVFAVGYYVDIMSVQDQISKVQAKEGVLKKEFEEKQTKAVNLTAYKLQMKEMEESFGTMLRQLPSKNEVADLLVDITQTGLASGLEFELFKPLPELPQDFYAELPINLRITGQYHNIGEFVSGIAALPRIVTLHDINISHKGKGNQLILTATAKTYRYLDEEEIAANKRRK
jgi:type IV pilus assembly protein PilO